MNPQTGPNLLDAVAAGLRRVATGMPEPTVAHLARSILAAAAEQGYGGTEYYLPGPTHLTRAERNERIRREWTGKNVQALCRKFAIGRTTLYRIVSRPRED